MDLRTIVYDCQAAALQKCYLAPEFLRGEVLMGGIIKFIDKGLLILLDRDVNVGLNVGG